jgi:hypothetical protein
MRITRSSGSGRSPRTSRRDLSSSELTEGGRQCPSSLFPCKWDFLGTTTGAMMAITDPSSQRPFAASPAAVGGRRPCPRCGSTSRSTKRQPLPRLRISFQDLVGRSRELCIETSLENRREDRTDGGRPVDLNWGGADCCSWTDVYRWTGSSYRLAHHFWGDVLYRLPDLNRDGSVELVSADANAFTAFAFSAMPVNAGFLIRSQRRASPNRTHSRLRQRQGRTRHIRSP